MTLLTIAIPIYNGVDTIRETLNSILSQTPTLQEKVYVVISDNNSTDGTGEILQEFNRNYQNVMYFKNPENIGYDRNYDLMIQRSPSEYVWTICDDDVIRPGAIQKVLDILRNVPDLSTIFVNCSIYDGEVKKCKTERILDIYDDSIYPTADLFYKETGLASINVSSNIVSRRLWMGVEKEDAFTSYWSHYEIISRVKMRYPQYRSYCIAEPLVIIRQGETVRWRYGDNLGHALLEKGLCLMEVASRMESQGYSGDCVKQLRDTISINIVTTILFARISRYKADLPLMKRMYRTVKNPLLVLVVYFPLMLIPRVILMVPLWAARAVKNRGRQ